MAGQDYLGVSYRIFIKTKKSKAIGDSADKKRG